MNIEEFRAEGERHIERLKEAYFHAMSNQEGFATILIGNDIWREGKQIYSGRKSTIINNVYTSDDGMVSHIKDYSSDFLQGNRMQFDNKEFKAAEQELSAQWRQWLESMEPFRQKWFRYLKIQVEMDYPTADARDYRLIQVDFKGIQALEEFGFGWEWELTQGTEVDGVIEYVVRVQMPVLWATYKDFFPKHELV